MRPQGIHRQKAALPGRNQIFHHDHCLAGFNHALDLVTHPMILGFGTHINKRKSQFLGHQSPLRNPAGSHAGHRIHRSNMFLDKIDKLLTDEIADMRIGKRDPVVAIDRRFTARCPSEGFLVVQFDSTYL